MPAPMNPERWAQNPDGSYSRKIGDRYYEDIATTGAAAERAQELGVDLSTVTGTGKDGRITKADVEAAAA